MSRFSTPRRLARPLAGLALAAGALLGSAGIAHADSRPSPPVVADACTGGSVNRSVSVTLTTTTDFTLGFKVYAVTGSPTGPIVATETVSINNPPQKSGTVTFNLPPGDYYFDWEDLSGDGVTYSGRHSGLSDFYFGLVQGTLTSVAACPVVETTTTTIPPTTVTAAATTTTVLATTTTAATTTTVVVNPPTTPVPTTAAPTTAVVQTTAAASAVTLPATGSNSTPLVAAGVGFLGLGMIAVLATKRRRPAHQL